MGNIKMSVEGPLFGLRAEGIVARGIENTVQDIAEATDRMIDARLGNVLVNPTGYFKSQVGRHQLAGPNVAVDSGGVIYGPWLEGGGYRGEGRRFRGYSTFRKTASAMKREIKRLSKPAIDKMVRELN